jgi:hypothetical protein
MCKNAMHRTERCTLRGLPIVLCKCLDNPHHMA